jgi:hypothetical protein
MNVSVENCGRRGERQLDGLGNKLLVREYLTPLSLESELAREINRARAVLMRQAEARRLREQNEPIGFGLRSGSGESGAESAEERIAERSRSATPAAGPQTEARRRCGISRMLARDERAVCKVERVWSRGGKGRPAARGTKQNRALVTADHGHHSSFESTA